jgi:tetratricopeptide (TPR) repeat protein
MCVQTSLEMRLQPRRLLLPTGNYRIWLAAFALLMAAAVSTSASAHSDETAKSEPRTATTSGAASKEEIQSLIRALGSPRYSARREAANELRRIGAEAFDLLFTATEDADPEVAASARYLLRQIPVRWVQNDPAAVRRLLRNYGDVPDETRVRTVASLGKLPDRQGLAALCRVARYDRSPLVSRVAALAVIRPDLPDARRTPVDPDVIDRELGDSTRAAVTWLRQFRMQMRDPSTSVKAWQQIIEEESARLARNTEETNSEILIGLMWNLADVHRQLNEPAALTQLVDRMVRLESDDPERVAVALLMWLMEEKSWDAVDDLLTRHHDRFAASKRPLYAAALARVRQGKSDLAEQLAEQASRLDTQLPLEGFWMAKELEVRERYQWAVREYRRAIDNQPVMSQEAVLSRISLANMLHDHEVDKEAAEMLEPVVKAVRTDGNQGQRYVELSRYMLRNYEMELPPQDGLAAQLHFYRALQYRAEKDWQRHRDALKTAIQLDKRDADVLIAMYRVPEADEAWMADVRQRIVELSQNFQQDIDAAPNDPSAYNQWAWLISNTEGDFQKAIRYSQKSLDLNTDGDSAAASYLDTLGRCYYAAGDYENAIKHQRQAIEKAGYLNVMHRQLELFEKADAEQKAKGEAK